MVHMHSDIKHSRNFANNLSCIFPEKEEKINN
jgi:hypothetical protein